MLIRQGCNSRRLSTPVAHSPLTITSPSNQHRARMNLSPFIYPQAAVEPFPGYNIHLVNEAYGNPGGWLQASLYRYVHPDNAHRKDQ